MRRDFCPRARQGAAPVAHRPVRSRGASSGTLPRRILRYASVAHPPVLGGIFYARGKAGTSLGPPSPRFRRSFLLARADERAAGGNT